MKKVLTGLIAMVLGAGVPVAASAMDVERPAYVGVSLASIQQDDRFFGTDEFSTKDVFVRVGGRISDHFSSELRAGTTLSDKSVGGTTFNHDYHFGGYLKARHEFEGMSPYLIVGYGFGKETVTLGGSASETFSSEAYGAGIDFMADRLGVSLEYLIHYKIGSMTRQGLSIGIFRTF